MQTTIEPDLMLETWEWLQEDPRFDGMPYRFEVDAQGRITMSPQLNKHGRFQGLIFSLLEKHGPQGKAFLELGTKTPLKIYECDVAWALDGERLMEGTHADPATEICVEIRSPSNTHQEFTEKRSAYFAAGAREVWFVDKLGLVSFFAPGDVTLERSQLMPNFPLSIKL